MGERKNQRLTARLIQRMGLRMKKRMMKEMSEEERRDDRVLNEYEAMVKAITNGFYISKGYHLRKREWRLVRGKYKQKED